LSPSDDGFVMLGRRPTGLLIIEPLTAKIRFLIRE